MDDNMKSAWERFQERAQQEKKESGTTGPLFSQSLGEFMASHTPADYLINGLLRRGWFYGCTALGTTGKTALAQLLTKLIAKDQRPAFFGPHEVEHGKVAYFAGENPDDLRERFIADLDLSPGVTVPDDAVRFFPLLFNADEAYDQIAGELTKMGGADCLFVDTSAAYFTKFGGDENSNDESGPWARVLRALTRLPGNPTVVALCHPTKYVSEPALLMPRGGSAFFLELDGNLTLWRDRETGLITLSQNRMRGVEFEPLILRTELIQSPKVRTAKGYIMPTIRMVVVTEADMEIAKKAGRANGDDVLEAMLDNPRLSLAQLAAKCGWGDSEGAKSKVRRALNNLKDRKLATKAGDDWQLTRAGKAEAKTLKEERERQRQF
jgi:hypothetical protein